MEELTRKESPEDAGMDPEELQRNMISVSPAGLGRLHARTEHLKVEECSKLRRVT